MQEQPALDFGMTPQVEPIPETTREPRSDWLEARRVWAALVAGRNAVAETFQEAGRNYIVLSPADDPRGRRPLTSREHEVTRLMAMGFTDKEIGARLGITVSSVATHRCRAQRKLGIASRAMLTQLMHLLEVETEPLSRLSPPDGGHFEPVRVTLPDWSQRLPHRLTRAERHVALLLLDGLSNSQISERRGTSERTVANQIAAICRKTSVSGRRALAAALIRECLSARGRPQAN